MYNTISRVVLTVLNDVASLCCLFRSRNTRIERVYIACLRTRVCVCVCVSMFEIFGVELKLGFVT